MKFVHFTAPDGESVPVVASSIVDLKNNDGAYDRRAKTVIVLANGYQAVRETKQEIEQKLEGA